MIARRALVLLPLLALGGCASFDEFLSSLNREKAPASVPLS